MLGCAGTDIEETKISTKTEIDHDITWSMETSEMCQKQRNYVCVKNFDADLVAVVKAVRDT